jgi:hypothetical protein
MAWTKIRGRTLFSSNWTLFYHRYVEKNAPLRVQLACKKHPFFLKIDVFSPLNAERAFRVFSEKTPLFTRFLVTHVYTNIAEWPPRLNFPPY